MVRCMRSTSCRLNLRQGVLRPVQQQLHLFDINFRRRIALMPRHLLHPRRIRIIEEGKGGSQDEDIQIDHQRAIL